MVRRCAGEESPRAISVAVAPRSTPNGANYIRDRFYELEY